MSIIFSIEIKLVLNYSKIFSIEIKLVLNYSKIIFSSYIQEIK